MAESTDAAARGEGIGSRLECSICHQPGADVCVRITPSTSGAGSSVYAHRACATTRGIPVLYALVREQPTGSAS